jgi:hypothetical protein
MRWRQDGEDLLAHGGTRQQARNDNFAALAAVDAEGMLHKAPSELVLPKVNREGELCALRWVTQAAVLKGGLACDLNLVPSSLGHAEDKVHLAEIVVGNFHLWRKEHAPRVSFDIMDIGEDQAQLDALALGSAGAAAASKPAGREWGEVCGALDVVDFAQQALAVAVRSDTELVPEGLVGEVEEDLPIDVVLAEEGGVLAKLGLEDAHPCHNILNGPRPGGDVAGREGRRLEDDGG